MTVTQDIDIWTLVVNASVVVKVVLMLLIAVSFLSWMFIFQKWFAIRRARRQTEQFEREFWSGNELTALYQGAVTNRHTIGSLERVFEAGFREFAKLRGQRGGSDPSDMVNGARRAMRATFQREMDFLELTALYQGAVTNRHTIGSLERVFEAGFREFAKLRGQRGGSD